MLLVAAVLLCGFAQGQFVKPREINFEISNPYRVVDADSKNYFHRNGHIFSIKVQRKEAIIQKFDDETMKETLKKEIKMPKSYSLETVTEFGGKFLVFYSIYDKSRTSEQLYYREVDFKTGNWKGPEKKIIGTRGKIAGSPLGTIGYWSVGVTDKFDFYYSADDTKMLVQYRKVPRVKNDSKNHDEIGLYVFDAEMKEIHGGDQRMPYTEKKMNNIDYAVDGAGNAYILATVYEDNTTRSKSRDGNPNYHIELLKKTPAARRMEASTIELQDKFITTVGLYETDDNFMVCTGYYNKSNSGGAADGLFFAKVDESGALYDEQSFSIPVEILNQYESKRTRRKNEKKEDKDEAEFYNLTLRKLQFLSDGSIVMIGEQYYRQTHTSYSNGRSTTYYTYHYNDMLISKIDPAGELEWMRKLPKSQYGRSGMGTMSFKHIYGEGYHYILYLDHEKNLNLPFDEAPTTYTDGNDGFLRAFVVDDTRGEVTQESIFDMRDAGGMRLYQFTPSKIMKITEDDFVFEAYKKKKEDVMVKISLKES